MKPDTLGGGQHNGLLGPEIGRSSFFLFLFFVVESGFLEKQEAGFYMCDR